VEIVQISSKPAAKRVLIVSTYKTRCGMASHSEVMISHLKDEYAIDVFPLDQFVLRNRDKRANEAGNRSIFNLCKRLKDYDAVVLQWEPGFWGVTNPQILRRVKMFCQNVRRLIMINHTVMPEPSILSLSAVRSVAAETGLSSAVTYLKEAVTGFHSKLYKFFKDVDDRGDLTVLTHTRRDKKFLEMVVGFRDVRDHPLFHIHAEWRDQLDKDSSAARKELESIFGADSIFVSSFGFLTEHKSIDTTINAMRFLPKNYKLLIYGGVHPNAIKEFELINPYVKTLTSAVTGDVRSIIKYAPLNTRAGNNNENIYSTEALRNVAKLNSPIADRVFFMGSPEDYDFAVAIGACDVAVLPYLEVGQSASGPASQILELGARLVATTARPFAEIERYFPGRVTMFDTGNHLQLATAVQNVLTKPKHKPFSIEPNSNTQREFYVRAIEDTSVKGGGKLREVAA